MQDNEKALLCGTSLHFHKWLLNGQREIPGRIPPQHQHCTRPSRMSMQAYPPDSIPRCSLTRTENLGLWAMMNTSRDLLHLPHTSTRRVRRGGPSDLVPFGGAARTYKISSPTLASLLPWAENRARMVSGALPSKPHEAATANFGISGDLLLVNAKSNTPFSRAAVVCNHKFGCPASVSSMWSADAYHGRSSRSGLSTPGLLLHLLHQCVDGVGLPAAPGRRCRRGAPGIGQVAPRQTIRQHRCEPEA